MVWRRRRVGKTKQLIRFVSFILILACVTSNSHTRMVFADVMSTSFADKLCLHISTPAAYMTAPSLSWYRLVVFRALHGVFFRFRDKSAHFFGIYCRNPHLPLNGSKCSSIQRAEPNHIQWFTQSNEHVPNFSKRCYFIFQTTLSSCCFVVKSDHWQEKPETIFCHDYREN